MRDAPATSSRDIRLLLYVASGVAVGAAYAFFDAVSEAHLEDGTLTGRMALVHGVVDHFSPVIVGALLGVCLHYFRLRARLTSAETAASRARARLQKVERDQAVWVLAAAVLHELNNPLHAIGLLADELAASDADAARRKDLVERMGCQAERARAHLRTLRTMRTSGEPEVESVTLDEVVALLARDVAPVAAEDGLVVDARAEQPVRASADPTYVRVILENLVENALASLREGGAKLQIRVSAEGDRAVVRVCDDGPPIEPRIDAALFEPLRSTKTHGLGLGLPIARALARAMGGDLALESTPAQGAPERSAAAGKTFRLELPLWEAA